MSFANFRYQKCKIELSIDKNLLEKTKSMDRDELEAKHKGKPTDEVPELEPDTYCNARKVEDGKFAGYCKAWAGHWTDNDGGRCSRHGGASTGPDNPNVADNAEKHALTADPKKYHERLDPDEKDWVFEMTEVVLDRVRANKGDIDPLDRTLARRVVIKLHIAAKASDYINREGLMETVRTADGVVEMRNRAMDELRRYDKEIFSELETLGLMDDPESQKADALEGWKEYISE